MTSLFVELAVLLTGIAVANLLLGMLVARHVARTRAVQREAAWKARLVELSVRRQRESERLEARIHKLERENVELRAIRQAHEDAIRVLRHPHTTPTSWREPRLEDEPFDETLDLDVLSGGRPIHHGTAAEHPTEREPVATEIGTVSEDH